MALVVWGIVMTLLNVAIDRKFGFIGSNYQVERERLES